MRLSGKTTLLAHLGYPTESFKAPMIYNPYFEAGGIDALVVPMGVKPPEFEMFFKLLFKMSNIGGALITMPHKVSVVPLLDETSTAVKVAGSCNAVLLRRDGTLLGDMFDGEGFVRGAIRKGQIVKGRRALVVGSGGVGSAIAASLAAAGLASIGLHDLNPGTAEALATRLKMHYPQLTISTGSNDPSGYDIVVNATPMGMNPGDPMPLDISRIDPSAFVGEVVMKEEMTAFLHAAQGRGCRVQIGLDMLFEQIPAYLEFFGFPTTTAENLRSLAEITY